VKKFSYFNKQLVLEQKAIEVKVQSLAGREASEVQNRI